MDMDTLERFVAKFLAYFETFQAYVILLLVTPAFFIIEIVYVRNGLIEIFRPSAATVVINTALTVFGFVNIIGNYALSLLVNNRADIIDDSCADETWSFCDVCKKTRPPKSWHCKSCHVCILGRDHHCFFMARCIGQYNKRFYILYAAYLFIGMLYSSFFNFLYIYATFESVSLLSFVRVFIYFIDPNAAGLLDYDTMFKELFLLYFNFNLFLLCWSGSLLNFHMRNILKGISSHERKSYRRSTGVVPVKDNLVRVFGENWFWAAIWPLAVSPLPDERVC